MGWVPVPSKRMTPSRPQEPSEPPGESQIFCAGPPETSIFLSFPSAKKPRNLLSGDQKGRVAPSVPASGWAASALSGRTQIRLFPDESVALNARYRPSGEIRGASIVVIPSGFAISKRIRRGGAGARLTKPMPRIAAAVAAAAASPQASF